MIFRQLRKQYKRKSNLCVCSPAADVKVSVGEWNDYCQAIYVAVIVEKKLMQRLHLAHFFKGRYASFYVVRFIGSKWKETECKLFFYTDKFRKEEYYKYCVMRNALCAKL